jgi:hypothetical protein
MLRAITLVSCLLFVACSSSNGGKSVAQPDLDFVQVTGPAEQSYPEGDIEVQYGIRITNRSDAAITLRQIQLESVGPGGAYQIRRSTYYFEHQIEANDVRDITFWARAQAAGTVTSMDARAPITVRGVAIFESSKGALRKVFVKMLGQAGPGL